MKDESFVVKDEKVVIEENLLEKRFQRSLFVMVIPF